MIRVLVLNCLSPLILLSIGLSSVFAVSDGASSSDKLQKLNADIDYYNNQLEIVYKTQKEFKVELMALNRQMYGIRQEDDKLRVALDTSFKEWATVNTKIGEIDAKVDTLKERSVARLRSLYLAQNNNRGSYLAKVYTGTNLPVVSYLLGKVEKFDRELLSELSALYQEQRVLEEKYERILKEQKLLKLKIMEKAESLSMKISRKESVTKLLNAKQKEMEFLITKLRAQALRLETVVTSITEGESYSRKEAIDRNSFLTRGDAVRKGTEEAKSVFLGTGLKPKDSKLLIPVSGKILRRFGKVQVAEFNDFVLNKGLLFEVARGSKVMAIAPARVLYIGRLPGYGNMVILDHGKRHYSLYAKLDATYLKPNQVVQDGTEVGTVGTDETEGEGNFYFEIRVNGKPVNPNQFFNKI